MALLDGGMSLAEAKLVFWNPIVGLDFGAYPVQEEAF